MPKTTDWPYDALQNDPLAALRIPVIRTPYPDWKYEVCLVIDGEDGLYAPALRPDEAETRMIAAYIDYRREYYDPRWQAKMLQRPLDIDSGTNTVILQKRAEGDWCYRRMSFEIGPPMFPPRGDRRNGPLNLAALLDKINEHSARWGKFKAAHPEVFPAADGKARR